MPAFLTYRGDRLGARLCALINSIRLSRISGLDYKVAWLPFEDYEVNDAASIFSEGYIASHFETGYIDQSHLLFDEALIEKQTARDFVSSLADDQFFCVSRIAEYINFLDTDPDSAPKAKDLLGDIEWHPMVAGKIQDLLNLPSEKYCALHIRRGDLMVEPYNHLPFFEKFAPTALYEAAVQRFAATGEFEKFVIFSDDPHMAERFKQKFNFCIAPSDIFSVDALTTLQRDLLEIILMSTCHTVLAPAQSAFSQVASMIGGATSIHINELFSIDDRVDFVLWDTIRQSAADPLDVEAAKNTQMLAQSLLFQGQDANAAAMLRHFAPERFGNICLLMLYIEACINSDLVEALSGVDKLFPLISKVQARHNLMHGFPIAADAHALAARTYAAAAEQMNLDVSEGRRRRAAAMLDQAHWHVGALRNLNPADGRLPGIDQRLATVILPA